MAEFYDPMLFISTPEHPNTMGVIVALLEPVDGKILRGVVDELRQRFPYFYIKAVPEDIDLKVEANPLPMTIRNTWEAINLNSAESNYHLGAWKYEGNRVAFEISHSITDGSGVLPYIKSAMYLYLSRKLNVEFDREGFRLPGDEIPPSEVGNPFAHLDIENAEEPLFTKEPVCDFYRLNDGDDMDPWITYVRLSEDQLMEYCRAFDGSPNAILSVLLARSVRRYDPANEKTVTVAVAIDHKAMLGNRDNYRMFANVVELDFPKARPLDDLMKACTVTRGQILLQAQPENSLWAMRQRKMTYARLNQMPLAMKVAAIAKKAGSPRWTISLSYANSRSFGPLDPYIDQVYVIATPGVSDILCEISCINRHFHLSIMQTFSSDAFVQALLEELTAVGIDCEVVGSEPLTMCGLEPFIKAEAASQQ